MVSFSVRVEDCVFEKLLDEVIISPQLMIIEVDWYRKMDVVDITVASSLEKLDKVGYDGGVHAISLYYTA